MTSELSLLAQARKLDREALREIHSTYYGPIYRYIACRVDDTDVVQDLTSEVFIRLLRALREQKAPQNTLRGWLYGAANHVVREHWRKQKREQSVELDESLPSPEASLQEMIEANFDGEQLRAALRELTDEQQTVISLRFASDLPIREVAEILGKSEGAVKQLQLRAIAALTRLLSVQV